MFFGKHALPVDDLNQINARAVKAHVLFFKSFGGLHAQLSFSTCFLEKSLIFVDTI
jgi:hypothetical protein